MTSTTNKKKTVCHEFRLFDFREKTLTETNGNKNITKYVIIMYGISAKGESCYIEVNDHKPFFYIKVPDNFTNSNLQELKNNIWKESKTLKLECELEILEMKKLYGFSGNRKHKFVKLVFQHMNIFNRVKQLWGSNPYTCSSGEFLRTDEYELYESNIPPLLRFFHINKISPSGWVKISGAKRDKAQKHSQCKYGFKCSFNNIIPLPDKETSTPFKICSFDIEASSSHGDFPVPLKSYKKLAMNIVDTFKSQAAVINESNAKYMLLKIINTAFGFDKVENVDIVYPKSKQTKAGISKIFNHHIDKDVLEIKKIWDGDERKKYMVQNADFLNPNDDDDNDIDHNDNQMKITNIGEKKVNKAIVKGAKDNLVQYLLHKTKSRDEKINVCDIVLTSILPDLKGDEVTFIGSTFMKYGEKEPYLNHCIVKGGCSEVPGAVIESVTDERSVLTNWTNIINKEDPDIIIGYNIFGFDYEFMFRRAQENHCEESFLRLSRSHTLNVDMGEPQRDVCAKIDNKTKKVSFNAIENKQLVIASGEYDLKFYDIPGRLQIDMYSYFRRDFNLSSYKLDDVASSYISDSIKHYENTIDENGEEICELYSSNLMGLHVNDFIHIELVSFTVDYYQGGKKFVVKNIVKRTLKDKEYNVIVIHGHQVFDPKKKLKWGVAKDDVTPQDIFRLTNGNDDDRAKVAKYCIQDCNLVHHLMNKIDVITGYIEMSNICSVPISFLVFRGQGIKLTSFVAKKCREKNTLMPDLEKKTSDSGYEGAIVLPPKCKMYMDNPVACVDYSSLYPSSMISQNYSHDSKVWTKTYDLDGNLVEQTGEKDASGNYIYDNLSGYEYIDIQFDVFEYRRPAGKPKAKAEKTKTGVKHCRWVQLPQGEKSIMPSILEELLKARKDTRKKAKLEKDPFMQNILDKRQLGYKVTANSLYGQCGARTSTFYEKDVAASTTATGRMMIIYGRLIIEKVYGDLKYTLKSGETVHSNAEYVYGDTDSVFFTFNLKDLDGNPIRGERALAMTIEIAQDAGDLCSKFLKPPMCLEYEKTLMPFILLSKKRYVGILYEDEPTNGYLKYMGLSLKRRDSCDYLKDTYGEIINILMQKQNVEQAIEYLNNSLQRLIDGNVPMEKLSITRALKSDYKNPQQIGHWVLSDRIGKRDPGNKPKPGDRIKYLFIPNKDRKALTGNKIETPEYIIANNLNIDYAHYITNQLMKPLQQLFSLAVEDIWKMQNKSQAIRKYQREIQALYDKYDDDLETIMKEREKIASAKVKTLLFDKFLKIIDKQQTKAFALETNHSIESFMTRR